LEHILRNCLLLLLEHQGSTLVSAQQLLTDPRFRQHLVNGSRDPVVRQFREGEFASMPDRLRGEAISPVLNKVGHSASNPVLRAIVGQPNSRLNLRRIMDEGKVLLCNFSKGRLGDDASTLLGSFLITAIQLAAMSRADLPETRRRDFFLTVDEFVSFATGSFAGILNIPRYHCVSRLLIDGQPSRPFVMETLPPSPQKLDPKRAEIIQRVSRRMLGRTQKDCTYEPATTKIT
jgi:hypothetical protein